MLKFLKKNIKIIILFFVSLAATVIVDVAFFLTGGRNLLLFIPGLALKVWLIINARAFIRALPPKILSNPLIKLSKRVLTAVFGPAWRVLKKLAAYIKAQQKILAAKLPKINLNFGRGRNRLAYYHDERSFAYVKKENPVNALKRMKWKALHTNRERVRYIYIAFLRRKAKDGLAIWQSDTANEVRLRLAEKEGRDGTGPLIPLYNFARYSDEIDDAITTPEVEAVIPYSHKRLSL